MFAKSALTLLAAAQLAIPLGKPRLIEQPRAPIDSAGPRWAVACDGSTDPNKPAPPVRIHANSYLVGTCGISSILIVGDQGDILIDGAAEQDAQLIADNIRALGYRIQDVRYILASHEHYDHVGGVAKLQQMSGAQVVTSAPAAKVLSSGVPATDDPQFGIVKPFPPAEVGRTVGDGGEVRLGNLMVTAVTTPGHAAGSLSWRWVSCDGGVCRTIVYADILAPVSNNTYRFSDHPAVVAALRSSIAKIAASPCEILLTPTPSASQLPERLALGKALLDPGACENYAAARTKDLDERLAKETAGPAPPPKP
ncbi:subclass B3 metallo-beta-lactamase [Sphingomonas sp.]|uniref:subclass B3 metallo-beta-lactamase n=1 Tax=Sphingomonas sp. TaxID=28214 RepID=UPI0038A4E1C1